MRRSSAVIFGLFLLLIILVVIFLRVPLSPPKNRVPSASSTSSVIVHSVSPGVTADPAYVVRAVDGDTLVVRMTGGSEERVRLIGINAPESVDPQKTDECFGAQASQRLHELLDGKDIELIPEPQDDRDAFGRLLRYVSLGNIDIGAEMIRGGYAESYCYRYPHPRCDTYDALQRAAVTTKAGMWGSCR